MDPHPGVGALSTWPRSLLQQTCAKDDREARSGKLAEVTLHTLVWFAVNGSPLDASHRRICSLTGACFWTRLECAKRRVESGSTWQGDSDNEKEGRQEEEEEEEEESRPQETTGAAGPASSPPSVLQRLLALRLVCARMVPKAK